MAEQAANAAAGTTRAELFVLSGPDVGRSFAVLHATTVGRSPDRGVVLRDKSISRHHAHFECEQGNWSIVDDGSTNGFVVDGARSQRATLTDLREFLIGEVLVRLRTQLPETVAQPAAPKLAPPPSQAAATAPTQPDAFEDEIVLEEEAIPARDVAAKPKHTFGQGLAGAFAADPAPAPAAAAAERVSAATRAAQAGIPARAPADAALGARGKPALQFHKQEARRGVLVSDLAQQPAWVRAAATLLALAIAAALAWGAYRGILSLRQDRGAAPAEAAAQNG